MRDACTAHATVVVAAAAKVGSFVQVVERTMRARSYVQYLAIIVAIAIFEIATAMGMSKVTAMVGDAGETVAAMSVAFVLAVILPVLAYLDRAR